MSNISAQEVQQYLLQHDYLKPGELAKRTGTTPEQILALEEAQCIPAASYVVEGEMAVTSSFGTYHLPVTPEPYYHPSIEAWVARALSLAQTRELSDVARIVRAEFDKHFKEALNGNSPPWPGGSDYAWKYMTDGTWGICLKNINMEHLLTKEYARATIREIVSTNAADELTSDEREQLIAAILAYRRVTMPFAPHEFDESSTQREINSVIEKYDIKQEELAS
ncbi:MAG: DUF6058 family natural product biosynthesis protein [Gammaproteobacteria bacterium]